MHCLLHWLLGKLLLNPHLCPVCFLEKALFPLLLQGETGRSCEGVSPEIYTRSRRISCAPFLSGTVEYNAHLHLYSLLKSFNHQRPGKYKHNPGHTQWRNDCSLPCVCVCIYFLMAFLVLQPCSRGEHGLHSEDMESRNRKLFSKAHIL